VERIPHPRGGHLAADVDRRDGPLALAYLHGFGSDRKGAKVEAFRRLAAEESWDFLAFEFRGHGESSGEIADLTLSAMLEDVDAALEAFDRRDRPLTLVGSSLGGLAAAWWSSRNPGRARGNVLIAPGFGFIGRFLEEIGPDRARAWQREGVLRYANEWLDVPLRWGLVEDARRFDEAALARAYATDTLVLHGLRDERVPWRASVEFAERCAHRPIDVVLLGDGDHRLQERVGDLTRHARDFLAARVGG
jgi:pimeloyl-ACP methyl ester carboxylesterase